MEDSQPFSTPETNSSEATQNVEMGNESKNENSENNGNKNDSSQEFAHSQNSIEENNFEEKKQNSNSATAQENNDDDEELLDDPNFTETIPISEISKQNSQNQSSDLIDPNFIQTKQDDDELLDDEMFETIATVKKVQPSPKQKKQKKPQNSRNDDEMLDDDDLFQPQTVKSTGNTRNQKNKNSNDNDDDQLLDDPDFAPVAVIKSAPNKKNKIVVINKNQKKQNSKPKQNQKKAKNDDDEMLDDMDLLSKPQRDQVAREQFKPYVPSQSKETSQQKQYNQQNKQIYVPQTQSQVERYPSKYQQNQKNFNRQNSYNQSQQYQNNSYQNKNQQNRGNKQFERRNSHDNQYNNNYNYRNKKNSGISTQEVSSLLDQYLFKPETQSIKYEDTYDIPRYYEMPSPGERRIFDEKPPAPPEREQFPEQPKFERMQTNPKKNMFEKNREKIVQEAPEKIATKGPVLHSKVEVKPLGVFSLTDKKNNENNKEPKQQEEKQQNNAPVQIKTAKGLTISLVKPKVEKTEQTKQSKSIVVESSSRESKGFLKEVQSSDPLSILSSPQAELNDIVDNNTVNNSQEESENNSKEFIPVRPISAPIVYNQTDLNEESSANQQDTKPQLVASFKPSPFIIKQNISYEDDFDFDDDDEAANRTKIDNTKFLNEVMGIEEEPTNIEPEEDEINNNFTNVVNNKEEEEETQERQINNNQNEIEDQEVHEIDPSSIVSTNNASESSTEKEQEKKDVEIPTPQEKETENQSFEEEKHHEDETAKPSPNTISKEDAEESIIPPASKPNQNQQGNSNILVAGVIFILVLIMYRVFFK